MTTLTAQDAGFDGDVVSLSVDWPDLSSADIGAYGVATVGPGIEFPSIAALSTGYAPAGGYVVDTSVDVSSNQITFSYPASAEGVNFLTAPFNGYVFSIVNPNAEAITGVSITETNIPGLTAADLTFTASTVDINVSGLTLPSNAPGSIQLSVSFAPQITGGDGSSSITVQTVQNDYFAITHTALSSADATTIVNSIGGGTLTETQYIDSLLSQVADTTIPAVAVEASMYGATGTSAEITSLVANFLPAQVQNAILNGYNPQVYACEALGLVFAFGNETGSTAFANKYGPLNAAMPNTTAGDAAFAAAAAAVVFGSAETAHTANVIDTWVSNWKAFYATDGIPGMSNVTVAQIDLAARGAAWGDAVGNALANNLGPLAGQATNFLEDAAQGSAVYSVSLGSQPIHAPFQG